MSISRIEAHRTNGWRVARKGICKLFSDGKYGGKEEALQAAREFDKTLPPKPAPPTYSIETHPELFEQVSKGSGVIGVHGCIQHIYNKDYYSWIARKGSGKNKKSRKFSVGKYGPLALQMAIETRQAWDEEQKENDAQTECEDDDFESTAK